MTSAERETGSVGLEKQRCIPTVKLQAVSVAGRRETEAIPPCPNKSERAFNKHCDAVMQKKTTPSMLFMLTMLKKTKGTSIQPLLDIEQC